MTIPTASNYPENFDTDTNLFVVHDALRMTLADDYNPGDTSIVVEGDAAIMSTFPDTGIITLTDQCSEITQRAISFYYNSRTDYTFDDLGILPEFENMDVAKPKGFTHVTLNVVAQHHNYLKDAIIAIEEFVGVKGTIDTMPLGNTLEGRVNFLRKLVFTPRAWFKIVGNRIGQVPLEITFEDMSARLGPGEITYLWDFGDSTTSVISTSIISTSSVVSCSGTAGQCSNITKTYLQPGKYDVTLTVSNIYGSDTVRLPELINARIEAPDLAVVNFLRQSNQLPVGSHGIRSPVDVFVDLAIPSGVNPDTITPSCPAGRSYSGELLDGGGSPIDPVVTYTWSLADDLTHANQTTTRALYGVGGKYDMRLRVDTLCGSYRITNYKQAIDIVESTNLWLWTFDGPTHPVGQTEIIDYLKLTGNIRSNEFGLISETFKTSNISQPAVRNDEFLESDEWEAIEHPEYGYDVIASAKKEFRRNVAFTPAGTTPSGASGTCVLYYATGGVKNSSLTNQEIEVTEYNAFTDTYHNCTNITRPWNWVFLGGAQYSYFILGQNTSWIPATNPSYQFKTAYNLTTMTANQTEITTDNYKNGANELIQHVSVYEDTTGRPLNGWYAAYRSTWKNNTGYFLRNDGVGTFFRIKSFYKTESSITEDLVNIKKLPDMDGPTKLEGQLVPLTSGVFFFNNSGSISAYNDTTTIWETGGPSADSLAFHSIQDANVTGYNSGWNTLLAVSNNDYVAYLSYDYSNKAFVKFNGQDLTFTIVHSRPEGSQFAMGVY